MQIQYTTFLKKKKKNPGTYFKFLYYDTKKQMEFGYK